eukprot:5447077-Amphidinium_carterae.1
MKAIDILRIVHLRGLAVSSKAAEGPDKVSDSLGLPLREIYHSSLLVPSVHERNPELHRTLQTPKNPKFTQN